MTTVKNTFEKKSTLVWIALLFISMLSIDIAVAQTKQQALTGNAFASYSLNLKAPIIKWDEAIPLGNGMTGGLLWGKGNEINLSLDRGDLWDNRPHPGFTAPGFNYRTVVRMAQAGLTDSLNKKYAKANDYPTKLPGCRLVLTMPVDNEAKSFHLDMIKGLGSVNFGDKKIECFFSAVKPVALIKIPGTLKGFKLLANAAIVKLGNPPAELKSDDKSTWLVQDAQLGFRYVFFVQSRKVKNYTLLAISSATNESTKDPLSLALKQTTQALDLGYESLQKEHENWWSRFWSRSSITIPDSLIQHHYNLVQYFYGAASRKGAPPIPLQGVWTADAGILPPWHGDYHHDLNTQLTYWAYLTSNRMQEGESFLDFMWSLKPVHEEFARNFYGVPGLVVPGVMALDGKPMGAWYQYTLSPTMGAWVAQSFYLHWRYAMDPRFLRNQAYPYCKAIAEALTALMIPENGKLKLPVSSSPEIHNNSQQAWVKPNSNFDLSLIRWLFEANAEMARALQLNNDVIKWQRLLADMDPLAVDDNSQALLVSPDEALTESHRHFSHLMAIYPLSTLSIEGTKKEREIIDASLRQMDSFGSKFWCGYSFSWMACMRARVGQADSALRNLKDYMDCTSRNGFHLNGPQTRKELSRYYGDRAFTLEGNFAASQAVHDMVLQSWGNRLRIFPAIPAAWQDASFHQLRAEGGFFIDAERKGGSTIKVKITATVDQLLRLKSPFDRSEYKSNIKLKEEGDDLLCKLKAGQSLVITLK